MPGFRAAFITELTALLTLTLLARPALAQKAPPPPSAAAAAASKAIIGAEFGFAADAARRGTRPAFLASMHDSAVYFPHAAPVTARAYWLAQPAPDTLADPLLLWAPTLAGAGASGELGYTAGPWLQTDVAGKALAAGQFFTIWGRQPDGTFRWLLDIGTGTGVLPKKKWLRPENANVARGPMGTKPTARDERPTARTLDDELSADMVAQGMIAAYETRLHPQAWLLRDGHPPISTTTAIRQQVSLETPRRLTFGGGRTAASGELAYSYGQYQTETRFPERGAYVHLWLHTTAGWQLLAEVINPAAPGGAK